MFVKLYKNNRKTTKCGKFIDCYRNPCQVLKVALRRLERVFRCYGVCETMKDTEEGYFIV